MCIIVAIPQGKQVTKQTLKRCWDNNPHGGGFMYSDGKKVIVEKEMSSFKRYCKALMNARANFDTSFVLHFRISTHGKINETNCHPFLANKNLGFANNGIIYAAPTSDNFSDTYMFNEAILKHLPTNFLTNNAYVSLIAQYIGSGSKLAFLNTKGEITIINEKAGVWDNGVWYSNTGYKATNYFDYGGTKVASFSYGVAKPIYTQSKLELSTTKKESDNKVVDKSDVENQVNHDCIDCGDTYSQEELDWYGNPKKFHSCDYCGCSLATSSERMNGCCNYCFNAITNESETDWLGYKRKY